MSIISFSSKAVGVAVIVLLQFAAVSALCPALTAPNEGTGTCAQSAAGATCVQTCTYSVFYNASATRVCQADNTWTEFVCAFANGTNADDCHSCCQPIGPPTYGTGNCGLTPPGRWCSQICSVSNFWPPASVARDGNVNHRYCINGVWDTRLCAASSGSGPGDNCPSNICCPALTAPALGGGSCPQSLPITDLQGRNLNSATYYCSSQFCNTFAFLGCTSRLCQSDLTWTPYICQDPNGDPAESCGANCCPALTAPEGGSGTCPITARSGVGCSTNTCTSQSCTYGVFSSLNVGSSSRACNVNGTWSKLICKSADLINPAGPCPQCCQGINPPAAASPSALPCNIADFGQACPNLHQCQYGVYSGSTQRVCGANNQWSPLVCRNQNGGPAGVVVGNAVVRDIVGGAAGGVAGIAFLALLVFFFLLIRPKLNIKPAAETTRPSTAAPTPEPKAMPEEMGQVGWQDLPDQCMESPMWWLFWGAVFVFSTTLVSVSGPFMPWFRDGGYLYGLASVHTIVDVGTNSHGYSYCDDNLPFCSTECISTSAVGSSLVAFSVIFSFVLVLLSMYRARRPKLDKSTYWRASYLLAFIPAFFIFCAIALHGGWCFYLINKLETDAGASMMKHSIGFAMACIALLANLAMGCYIRHKNVPPLQQEV